MNNFQEKVSFIWSVADLLRGDYKQSEYGRVILPLTVMRRLDCVLEPKKEDVLEKAKTLPKKADEAMRDLMLCQAAGKGMTFYNTSKFVLQPTEAAKGKGFVSLLSDQDQIAANLSNYIAGFTPARRAGCCVWANHGWHGTPQARGHGCPFSACGRAERKVWHRLH